MHDILFTHQQELGNGYLVEYANHLDLISLLQDMFKQVHVARINIKWITQWVPRPQPCLSMEFGIPGAGTLRS